MDSNLDHLVTELTTLPNTAQEKITITNRNKPWTKLGLNAQRAKDPKIEKNTKKS